MRAASGAELLWPVGEVGGTPRVSMLQSTLGVSIPIFAPVLGDGPAMELLRAYGGSWSRAARLRGRNGADHASVWVGDDGGVFLPFDPDEACAAFWRESYLASLHNAAKARGRRGVLNTYYTVRRVLPRSAQIWLRRRYALRQAKTAFPRWPVETALHDLFDLLSAILADVAGEPIPRLAPWPDGHGWALVLTHDVETAEGLAALEPVLALERGLGLRSCWNLVPRRYEVDDELVRRLTREGFEVGVHGLYHDGRDLRSRRDLLERLPAIRAAATRWRASGFRSPSTQRAWELMPLLEFDYDSSYPDTDPFEPQGGGCCTWLPFFNEQMVELPLTMPQDHTLFVILSRGAERAWIEKAEFLRDRGGMALIDTHPDYLLDGRIMSAYRELLERFADDPDVWRALPREVSSWWRRRAASRIRRVGGEWAVCGPAAGEARIELVEERVW